MKAKDCSITENNQKLLVSIDFLSNCNVLPEYIASSVLMSLVDTSKELIHSNQIATIDIVVSQSNVHDTFHYFTKDITTYSKALEITSYFVYKFINKKTTEGVSIVDTTKINLEKLQELNSISDQLSSDAIISSYTFDGFRIYTDQKNIMQMKVQLLSNGETITATIQYDSRTEKIFYFGINDEL